jgi:pimeloyl-ACP methyl ester carboxylesterase
MSTPSVNIVLVHGAFSDASGWSKVIPSLQSAGHNVVAVQNELMSLKDDSDNTRAAIDAMPGPTVVAGHSYGAHMAACFAGDLPPTEGAVLAATQRPIAPAAFGEKMEPPAWKQHKSWYQVSENDEMIPPDAERWMARRAGATTISREIADLILRACAGATVAADGVGMAV